VDRDPGRARNFAVRFRSRRLTTGFRESRQASVFDPSFIYWTSDRCGSARIFEWIWFLIIEQEDFKSCIFQFATTSIQHSRIANSRKVA